MRQSDDNAHVAVPPPLAWVIAIAAGLAAGWAWPVHVAAWPVARAVLGAGLAAAGITTIVWARNVFRAAGTRLRPDRASTAIVADGPYRFTRNPIYLAMALMQAGGAVAFGLPWLLATLVPFYFVIRYGVIAREEIYLERKFGAGYRDYKMSVRRWL